MAEKEKAEKTSRIKAKIVDNPAVERFVAKGDKEFVAKHLIQKWEDRNGNGDDVFCGSKVKPADRFPHHGYTPEQSAAVYEDTDCAIKKQVPKLIRHIASLQVGDNEPEEGGDERPDHETAVKNLNKKHQKFHHVVAHESEGRPLSSVLSESNVEKAIFHNHVDDALHHASVIADLLKELKKIGEDKYCGYAVKDISHRLEDVSEQLARTVENCQIQHSQGAAQAVIGR